MQLEELEEILEQARRNNESRGITGALVYVDGVFLQILEGERGTVEALMDKISQDVRHETVTVLQQADIPSAAFVDWKMAYVSATAAQVAKWAGLSGTALLPEVLSDIGRDPNRATQVAESILSALVQDRDSQNTPRAPVSDRADP